MKNWIDKGKADKGADGSYLILEISIELCAKNPHIAKPRTVGGNSKNFLSMKTIQAALEPYLIQIKKVCTGDNLSKINIVSKELYYVKIGACKQIYINSEGEEVTFRLITENDFCASAYSLITKNPAFDLIQCVKGSTIYVYDYGRLEIAYESNTELANLARKIVERSRQG